MRKFIVLLMLAISFTFGMASQTLIAGNWIIPVKQYPPVLRSNSTIIPNGMGYYQTPSGWKIVKAVLYGNDGQAVGLYFRKLE